MIPTPATSPSAAAALDLVRELQQRLVHGLAALEGRAFAPIAWLRDGGRHGGGTRLVAPGGGLFNRASVNTSQVHYEDRPDPPVRSATALSAIVHPDNPYSPSVHIHLSLTEPGGAPGAWRIMADLNPALELPSQTARFLARLAEVAPAHVEEARARGDRYFAIPALGRRRGVAHFYLEGHRTSDPHADLALARRFGEGVVDRYVELLAEAVGGHPDPTEEDRARQLAYHTVYLFQVLTLDRGTSSGLLAHDQNDVGVLGSLPARVDRELLASWATRLPSPQDELLGRIVACLPPERPSPVEDAVKAALAAVVRSHYRAHPEALALQAA